MNRSLATVAVVGAVAAVAAIPATGLGAAAPKRDSVQGAGQNNPPVGPVNHFIVSATANPDGSDPRGFAQFHDTVTDAGPFNFRGDVLCLRVDGKVARLVMRITRSTNPAIAEGRLWRVDVEDHGKNTAGENVDEVRNGPAESVNCNGLTQGTTTLMHGNIRVEDAG